MTGKALASEATPETVRATQARWIASLLGSTLVHAVFAGLVFQIVLGEPQPESVLPAMPDLAISVEILPPADSEEVASDPASELGVAQRDDYAEQKEGDVAIEEKCGEEESPSVVTMAEWKELVQVRFAHHKRFPDQALRRGLQGISLVLVTVCHNGEVLTSRIAQSSGIELLDQESLRIVQRANPLPNLPDEFRGKHFKFIVPIEFLIVK